MVVFALQIREREIMYTPANIEDFRAKWGNETAPATLRLSADLLPEGPATLLRELAKDLERMLGAEPATVD